MPSVKERQAAGLAKARETYFAECAHRALEDPIKLAKAARIVRAALARGVLSEHDLTPLPDPHS